MITRPPDTPDAVIVSFRAREPPAVLPRVRTWLVAQVIEVFTTTFSAAIVRPPVSSAF